MESKNGCYQGRILGIKRYQLWNTTGRQSRHHWKKRAEMNNKVLYILQLHRMKKNRTRIQWKRGRACPVSTGGWQSPDEIGEQLRLPWIFRWLLFLFHVFIFYFISHMEFALNNLYLFVKFQLMAHFKTKKVTNLQLKQGIESPMKSYLLLLIFKRLVIGITNLSVGRKFNIPVEKILQYCIFTKRN